MTRNGILIGSDKVESTPVYGADDRKIGTVQRVMIDKVSGKVATLSFHSAVSWAWARTTTPMAWTSLKYDTNLGGDRVRVTEDQFKDAPKYNRNTEWDWTDRAATKQSMTIIAHRFGTLDMIKRLGENPPSFL